MKPRTSMLRGVFLLSNSNRVHFIGIGGIGMCGLARWFLSEGVNVSGSDISPSPLTKELERLGAKIFGFHRATNIGSAKVVIYNQAIPKNNSELVSARKRGRWVLSYPEAVGILTRVHRTVAIAGAHGKSTTAALTALMLVRARFNPRVLIGTRLKEFNNSGFRPGSSPWLVLEADEYGRAFHNYSPLAAIITNIDKEHLDIYGDLNGVKTGFLSFIGAVRTGGILVINGEDANLRSLRHAVNRIAVAHHLSIHWYRCNQRLAKILRVPGAHNLSNASGVYALGMALKIPPAVIMGALHDFRGSWRRLEERGQLRFDKSDSKCTVFDDYAHHPTEIKASIRALKDKYPGKKLICVFQPHQEERLKRLFADFQVSFSGADEIIILDTYSVAGRDKAVQTKYSSKALADAIKKKYPHKEVIYLADKEKLKKTIVSLPSIKNKVRSILVMMGAGDIDLLTPGLLKN